LQLPHKETDIPRASYEVTVESRINTTSTFPIQGFS